MSLSVVEGLEGKSFKWSSRSQFYFRLMIRSNLSSSASITRHEQQLQAYCQDGVMDECSGIQVGPIEPSAVTICARREWLSAVFWAITARANMWRADESGRRIQISSSTFGFTTRTKLAPEGVEQAVRRHDEKQSTSFHISTTPEQ